MCTKLVLRRIGESKLNRDSANARYRCTKLIFLFKINCSLKANIVKCNMQPSSHSSLLCGEWPFCVRREKKVRGICNASELITNIRRGNLGREKLVNMGFKEDINFNTGGILYSAILLFSSIR